ncbi:MAG: amidohydrolase family protein, partial [Rivularia sp. ALOHA_DT_140]|nr:amidohydrolase family protein [Rivularia sp. ALOHA_DT_140]
MSSPSLLIRRARIILPGGNFMLGDVLTRDRKIIEVSPSEIEETDTRSIDADGLTLLPGVIDPQVHFREPGLEHKEDLFTASCACAKGGVTSFLEMPNTRPLTISQETLNDKLERASSKSLVNYGFFIGATSDNLSVLLHANPTPGIKIFMGAMHGPLLVDPQEILEGIFANGEILIAVHAEDQTRLKQRREEFADIHDVAIHSRVQDNQAALIATRRALKLSQKYRRRLHILHMSTAEEANLLREDKPSWV